MQDIVWSPSPSQRQHCNMTQFIHYVNERYQCSFADYPALYQWSIGNKEQFWESLATFAELRFSRTWDSVIDENKQFPGYEWFANSRLNFAENLLRYANQQGDKTAIVFWGEDQHGDLNRRCLSYSELHAQVAKLAAAMRAMGVTSGDRVAGYLPNLPESIVAMLATTSIGAVWSSCSPDFGLHAVLDRFGQIQPKLLFASDGYYFKGKAINKLDLLASLASKLPDLISVVVVAYIRAKPDISAVPKAKLYQQVLANNSATEIDYAPLPFNHPIYILYSSGTTGKPKCIVHGAGGTLLQHLKELLLHCDISAQDRVFYFTTCGWMMWNWLVSNLALGATVMLYDGAPMYPRNDNLLEYADKENISVFGTSAKFLSALQKSHYDSLYKLDKLRLVLSTGSPLAPESYQYVDKHIKSNVQLASISGGTDIISCFALGNPLLPVYRGELQCIGLGMEVKILSDQGVEVVQQKGELCCKPPFPSMPVSFWNDTDNAAYKKAYFEKFPGFWVHGDYAELTKNQGVVIYGRSDAILNPGGVRIGTAEIYRQVEKLAEINESIAVAQEWHNDVRIILFVTLSAGVVFDQKLQDKIREIILINTTPRHVPAKIIRVADIPRTISGKIVELAVCNIIHNRPVKNMDALANPQALDAFKNLKELYL